MSSTEQRPVSSIEARQGVGHFVDQGRHILLAGSETNFDPSLPIPRT